MATTWNPADLSGITLSGGNLIATGGNFTGVRATKALNSGKYYFEITITTMSSGFVGLAKSTADLTSGTSAGAVGVSSSGVIEVNGTNSGLSTGSVSGKIVGIAVDLTANLIWFRAGASGSWNAGSGTANDPATGTGGVSISAITGMLFPWFTSVFGGTQTVTANFGASALNGALPSGYTSGWPDAAAPPAEPPSSYAGSVVGGASRGRMIRKRKKGELDDLDLDLDLDPVANPNQIIRIGRQSYD